MHDVGRKLKGRVWNGEKHHNQKERIELNFKVISHYYSLFFHQAKLAIKSFFSLLLAVMMGDGKLYCGWWSCYKEGCLCTDQSCQHFFPSHHQFGLEKSIYVSINSRNPISTTIHTHYHYYYTYIHCSTWLLYLHGLSLNLAHS